MGTIKNELNKLKTSDIYSLLLFALYKMRGIPEYSTLSELAYTLDKDNLLNLCEYFGGLTLKIPTIDDLENMVDALLLYQYVDIDNIPYSEATAKLGFESNKLREVKKNYKAVKKVLSEYSFIERK